MEKIKDFIKKLNEYGVPLPLLHDPKTGRGSVSLTMMFISFNVVVVGLIGKYAKMLEGIDLTQAMYLFLTTSGLYLGRKMQFDGKSTTVSDDTTKENNDKN